MRMWNDLMVDCYLTFLFRNFYCDIDSYDPVYD